MSAKRQIGVFIASPSDLAVERRAFYKAVEELNGEFAEGANQRAEALAARADEFALMLAEQVAKDRGDLDKARELWTKARDLFAKIGMKHMNDKLQAWLDGLDEPKGDGSSEE